MATERGAEPGGILPVGSRVTLGFAMAVLAVLAVGLAGVRTTEQAAQAVASVAHTQEVLRVLHEAMEAVFVAESEQRAYLLTGDTPHLDAHQAAAKEHGRQLARLRALVGDNPAQQARAEALERLTRERLAEQRRLLETFAREGLPAAARALKQAPSTGVGARLQQAANALEEEEERLLSRRTAQAEASKHAARWALFLGTGLLALLLVAGSVAITRSVARPVARLMEGAQRLGRGERGVRVKPDRSPELAAVARAFNEMATRRDEFELALTEERDRATRMGRELESFCYSVSHDLRAPLRGIDGFSHALQEDCSAALSPEGQEHLGRIRAAARRMSELIDDLLRLSRITRAELNRERVDVSGLATSIAQSLAQQDPARRVQWDISPGMECECDRAFLRIALENLLSNAWKFTRPQPDAHIRVWAEHDAGQQRFTVADNGVGFDARYADKLFGVFQRLHPSSEFPGTGIGLATVQRIVDRHGGRIWARGATGEGASFSFTLLSA